MAFSWGDLKAAIPFRLNRPDLPADFVSEMLDERIGFYGPDIFAPAERTDYSITTQPGQFFYPLPSGFQALTFVRVLYGGIWIPVTIADQYTEILTNDPLQPPFTSIPVTLCRVYGKQLRLFPTPNGQYPVELTMMGTEPGPTDDNDETNWWVAEPLARTLLINATCAQICREYLDIAVPNSPRIATYDRNTAEALEKLQTQSHQWGTPAILKQWL